MDSPLYERVLAYAGHWRATCGLAVAIFDYAARDFTSDAPCSFCADCLRHGEGQCDFHMAHRYSCFEAERWNGLYVYYCPMSLAFLSTVVYERGRAAWAVVSGPVVMGAVEDALTEVAGAMTDAVLALPRRTPGAITALSQVQRSMAMYLSERDAATAEQASRAQADMHNTLYDITERMRFGLEGRYPLDIERRLQRMIVQGDRQGARELINELLGRVYFDSQYDFGAIRERAKELVVLFSRASMDGGADAGQIFGQNRDCLTEIDACRTLDDLSLLLTSIFYRFVGYVFDFSQFAHADILYKVVGYLRENLSEKVTMEELAARVGLSRGYLGMLFKAEMGATFTDYVNAMRVEKSKELLLNPALSLAEIADLVGYSDQSYYTKKFTQLLGVTPGQYRKRRGQIEG
ncbi:MAG: helix-turn-helix domain-containing protein [Oscillospiraceae bacterium]|jgi:AraC-like DNA-binding protein|nr:helix-turn-helix domain-containing protein [Oscillospiraceae bacterium]